MKNEFLDTLRGFRAVLLWIGLVILFIAGGVLFIPTLGFSLILVKRLRNYLGDGRDYYKGKGLNWIPEGRSMAGCD